MLLGESQSVNSAEGDLNGTSYTQAHSLTTRLGVFWVTALSLALLKPSPYSARSI